MAVLAMFLSSLISPFVCLLRFMVIQISYPPLFLYTRFILQPGIFRSIIDSTTSSIIRRAIKIACTRTVCQSQNVPYDNDALDSRFYVRIGTGLVFRMCSFCPLFTIKIALSTVCVRRVSWFHVVALPIDKSRGDEKFYDQKQTHHLKYSFCSKDLVVRMYSRIHQSRGKTNSTTRKRHDT